MDKTLNDLLSEACENCSYRSGLWLDDNAVSVCFKCKLKRLKEVLENL